MTRAPRHSNRLLLAYVVTASVLLHLLAFPLWAAFLDEGTDHDVAPLKPDCAEDAEPDTVPRRPCATGVLCPSSQDERMRVALVEEEEPPEPEPTPDQPFVLSPAEPESTEVTPRDDAYASSVDTTVESESVNRGRPGAVGAYRAAERPESRASEKLPDEVRESATESESEEVARAAPDLELPTSDDDDGESSSEVDDDQNARDAPAGAESEDLSGALPDFEAERLSAASQGRGGQGGSVDYLKDVKDGERTLLNRRRVSYSDFFERVKVGVVNHWNPISVYRRRDPTGRVYGVQDRVTVLNVTLQGDGTLASLHVERASGLDFLDAEAVRAMNAAVPFPNPPEGLKDIDGQVNFRFAFHVDVSTRKFRLFRYR